MNALTEPGGVDYSQVAQRYDGSRRAEPAIIATLCDRLDELRASSVLEIGAGTGNYTVELLARGFETVALERSAQMLAGGRTKARARWVLGDALRLPLKDSSFDAAVAVNVLHHLGDLGAALAELRRVVRRGAVVQVVVRQNLETLWYRHYFPEIDRVLLPLHPPLGAAICAFLRAGFERVTVAPIFYSGDSDLTFESARNRPRLLFDQAFRDATSGFRRLSGVAIQTGLAALGEDLESGRFAEIQARFESEHAAAGDCVILCAKC